MAESNGERNPLVTIVMAIHGEPSWLRPALDSVKLQTFSEWEFVGYLDGENPKAEAIVCEYGSKFRTLETTEIVGAAEARNRVIRTSTSPYIAVLDSDDVWGPSHLATLVEVLDSARDIVLVGTSCKLIDESGAHLDRQRVVPRFRVEMQLIFRNCFVHSSVVFRKNALDVADGYNANVRLGDDWDLWMRLALAGRITNIASEFIFYRIRPGQESRKTVPSDTRKILLESKKNLAKSVGAPRALATLAHILSLLWSGLSNGTRLARDRGIRGSLPLFLGKALYRRSRVNSDEVSRRNHQAP